MGSIPSITVPNKDKFAKSDSYLKSDGSLMISSREASGYKSAMPLNMKRP